jgi:hypothetical protein
MNAFRLLFGLTAAMLVLSGDYASSQTCHIITSDGACSSVNVVIPGVSGTGSAVCSTHGIYGDPVGTVIGPIFLTVVASQSCPANSGIMSVTQRASTAVSFDDTSIDGLRSSVVDDNGKTLFRAHGEENCATGFSETIDTNDPTACTPPFPPPPPGPPQCDTDSGDGFTRNQGGGTNCSPIIIDLTGDGFFLTSAANGVKFDIANTGAPIQIAWSANSNNAFLVLDRNGNGVINSGAELFGNFTPQPTSAHPNGFLALAQYDTNGDGVIDAKDPIYSQLRLWVDANHDGISQPGELHTLPEMGVFSISLNYSLSMRTDAFGNVFRYKANINQGPNGETDVGKKAYDVFFVSQ